MIPIAILGVVFIMACLQRSTFPAVIHSDPEVPVPPSNEGLGSGGASPREGYILNPMIDDAPPAYVDPSNPVPPPQGDDSGRTLDPGGVVIDPMIGDAFYAGDWDMPPVYVPPAPEQPVKTDPVVKITPPYSDPENPVPTDQERAQQEILQPSDLGDVNPPISNVDQPTSDFWNPVPTPESDPVLYASDAIDVPPAEDPMENWRAENTEDTDCDPNVEVEFTGLMA